MIFFASQCTPKYNNSKISETQPYVTNTKLSSVKFESKEINDMIRSLDVNKAHGPGNISIRMSKICDSAVVEQLKSFLIVVLIKVCFLISGKNQMHVLFIKKLTNNLSIITDQCQYYQFVERYLKDFNSLYNFQFFI